MGTPIAKPTGVFVKLDPEQVIADERARLADPGTPDPALSRRPGERSA